VALDAATGELRWSLSDRYAIFEPGRSRSDAPEVVYSVHRIAD
jgi:hypothetical protein